MSNTDWIAIGAVVSAVATALLSVGATLWLNHRDKKSALRNEVLKERREALLEALDVVDLVHHNAGFQLPNGMTIARKEFDISRARQAMNKILLFCEKPQETVAAYMRAIGLTRTDLGAVPAPIKTEDLHDFRNEVARELGLPKIDYSTRNIPWIMSLTGATDIVPITPPEQPIPAPVFTFVPSTKR